jgi:rhamnose transport system substrate-binding protein
VRFPPSVGARRQRFRGDHRLARPLRFRFSSCYDRTTNEGRPAVAEKITIAVLPKNTENTYFLSTRKGAEEAAAELGINLIWEGPPRDDPRRQVALIDEWVRSGVQAIAVSVADSALVSPALLRARERGIGVVTWDADGTPASRLLHITAAAPEMVGQTLASEASRVLLGKGDFAVITAGLNSPNQNAWIAAMREKLPALASGVRLIAVEPCDEDALVARGVAERLLETHADLRAILALCVPALLPALEAVRRTGRKDVKIVGVGAPNGLRGAIESGRLESVVGWNPTDLGYLTVHVASAVGAGALVPGEATFPAGRLGRVFVREDQVRLGRLHVFSRANLDRIPD